MIALRSALWLVYFWTMSAMMCIVSLPTLLISRQAVVFAIETWTALVLGGLKWIAGIDYRVEGAEHLPKTPALVAVKHHCMWDTIVMSAILKDPALILKKELLRVPLYGWYAQRGGMIPIDRDAHATALRKMVTASKAAMQAGRSIVIFPEGTRVPVGEKGEYKPGVAAIYQLLHVPCTPVALNSGLYWPRRGFVMRPGTIRVQILPPIPPGLKRPDFLKRLETTIEDATNRLIAEAQR